MIYVVRNGPLPFPLSEDLDQPVLVGGGGVIFQDLIYCGVFYVFQLPFVIKVFITTVVLPLSADRITMSLSPFSSWMAFLSSGIRLEQGVGLFLLS